MIATRLGRQDSRGFTLVELMITVAIVAILAVLATVGYSRWTRSAKTGEAAAILSSIKTQQDQYRSDSNGRYLDVSGGALAPFSAARYYPSSVPTEQKAPWDLAACGGNTVCNGFRTLGVNSDSATYYRYGVTAGNAGTTPGTIAGRVLPNFPDPWFAAQAVGDLNSDGNYSQYGTSSTGSLIWSINADE